MMGKRRHQDDPTEQAWPIVFIEPDPAQRDERSRHPIVRGFVTALLGIALTTGSWFAGRSTAPPAPSNASAAQPNEQPPIAETDSVPGRSVQALTPPPRAEAPALPVDPEPRVPVVRRAPLARAPVAGAYPRRRVDPSYRAAPGPSTISHLSLNSFPWGVVSIDGNPVANTPVVSLPVLPGFHRIRIEHAGFTAYDRVVRVAPGETFRLTGIVLQQSGR